MASLVNFDVMSPAFLADPYPTYARLHRCDEVLIDSHLDAYFVGHYADVSRILHSPEFSTAPLAKRAQPVMGDRVLAQMEGIEHHAKRRAVLSGLTGRLFRERYAPFITKTTQQQLAKYLPSGQIDLINGFGKEYSILVTLQVLGLPTNRHQEIALWHSGITAYITSLSMSDAEKKFSLECSKRLIEYLTPIIEQRAQRPGDDLISILCSVATDGHKMSTSEVVALVLNMLLAATEPADKTLAYLFKHLLDNTGQLEYVYNNRSLLVSAIDETLRLTSPVQLIPRQVESNVSIRGINVPKGALVFCMIGAANRDPAVFDQPNTFCIDRKKVVGKTHLGKVAHHLAFGAGPHLCVGAAFALMQIELTANLILDSLKNLQYVPDFQFREDGLYTRGPASLCLKFSSIDSALVAQPNHEEETS